MALDPAIMQETVEEIGMHLQAASKTMSSDEHSQAR
jgi:hypothetical protein